MPKRIRTILLAAVAAGALTVGGIAAAQGHGKRHHAAVKHAHKAQGTLGTSSPAPADGDTVQQGDQTAPDTPGAGEKAGENAGENAAENGPSDGPGGFADSNSNADTQQQGEH
jgi:hypothetical protein